MRHLTAIICLTLAVLLGSAGMSWSADAKTVQQMALICVEQYNQDPEKDQKFKNMMEKRAWERGEYIAEQGWATMLGKKNPDRKTSRKCAELISSPEALARALGSVRKMIAVLEKAGQGDADAQYQLALKHKNGDGVEKNLSTALSWANKAYQQGHAEAGKLHGELILQDFLYAGDVRELDALGKAVKKSCKGNMKCAFDKVWMYLDITGDAHSFEHDISSSKCSEFYPLIVYHQRENVKKFTAITTG